MSDILLHWLFLTTCLGCEYQILQTFYLVELIVLGLEAIGLGLGLKPGFRHPGMHPKKTQWVFWVHPPTKNPPPKNPHFYFDLILVYTLYATNNAIFYCF